MYPEVIETNVENCRTPGSFLNDSRHHQPANSRNNFWSAWIPAMIWLAVIAVESSGWLSSANTGRLLYAIVTFILGPIDPDAFAIIHALLRKIGHVIGYGILSFLLFRAWRTTLRPKTQAWNLLWAVVSFVMTAAVASLDEWHQTYLPSRTGTLHDVVLDSLAALSVQFLIFAFLWNRTSASERIAMRGDG